MVVADAEQREFQRVFPGAIEQRQEDARAGRRAAARAREGRGGGGQRGAGVAGGSGGDIAGGGAEGRRARRGAIRVFLTVRRVYIFVSFIYYSFMRGTCDNIMYLYIYTYNT